MLYVIAFIGGAASVLTPCVFPLLPAILAVSGGGRRRVMGIVVGIELSFFLIGLVLAGLLSATGLTDNALQWVAAALIAAFGAVLLFPALDRAFQRRASALVGNVRTGSGGETFASGVIAGAPLGIVWAPCAGPILAGITAAAASTQFSARTVATMAFYGLGMLGPLTLVIFGGQRITRFLRNRLGDGRRVSIVMGALLVLTAVVIASGGLNSINRFLAERINLTSTPTAALEERAIGRGRLASAADADSKTVDVPEAELEASGYPEYDELVDYGAAPAFRGVTDWFNSHPLSLRDLRGKVVLVDFWTYSCINCIRTLPYLRDWYSKYREQGLEIVGVHTPEFAFEKVPSNVEGAVKDFDLEYPVALDPDYKTWRNYHNLYWPAKYLIDKDGHLRAVHYGEGAYDVTEDRIRALLALPATDTSVDTYELYDRRTPEIYLGFQRSENFYGSTGGALGFDPEKRAVYRAPADRDLRLHQWAFEGEWTVDDERSIAGRDARIVLHFAAKDVFIVAGSKEPRELRVSGPTGTSRRVEVEGQRLYTLREGKPTNSLLEIEVPSGVEVYSFTFG
jgi:cytochrome c biogenesis protein CcdA/thiol-disulfide isomerase/thioredoxin